MVPFSPIQSSMSSSSRRKFWESLDNPTQNHVFLTQEHPALPQPWQIQHFTALWIALLDVSLHSSLSANVSACLTAKSCHPYRCCLCSEWSLFPQNIASSITGGEGGTGGMFSNGQEGTAAPEGTAVPWGHCPDVAHAVMANSFPILKMPFHSCVITYHFAFLPFAPQQFLFKTQWNWPLLIAWAFLWK